MDQHKGFPLLLFESAAEWRAWLDEHHDKQTAVWLKFAKKGSKIPTLTYEEARDTAIAYGWIDGQLNAFDESHCLRRFTPRKAKSRWSKINCDVAEGLIASGEMHASGLAQVEAAKQNGMWDAAYESQSTITVPDDFRKAMERVPEAAESFGRISAANRYAFLYRLHNAKTAEKRGELVEKFVGMLARGEVFHPKS